MNWMNALQGVLGRYANAGPQQNVSTVHNDYDQVAQAAPPEVMADGLGHAFRSDATPPFSQMVSQLFGNGSNEQKAGLLNTLLRDTGSAGALPPALAGLLGGAGAGQVNPQQAAQVPPQVVAQVAEQAEQHNPTVVDQVSRFYSDHPKLVKTLGAAALTLILARLAQQHRVI